MTDWRMIRLDKDDFEGILIALDIAAHAARGSAAAVDFNELSEELREQWQNEGIPEMQMPDEPTDLIGHTVHIAEEDFIDAGIHARERLKRNQLKEIQRESFGEFEVPSSRPFADTDTRTAALAAKRRDKKLMKGTATPCVPEFMNDPVDW